jgi:hypothetical protein
MFDFFRGISTVPLEQRTSTGPRFRDTELPDSIRTALRNNPACGSASVIMPPVALFEFWSFLCVGVSGGCFTRKACPGCRLKLFGKGASPKRGDSRSTSIQSNDVETVLKAGGKLSVEQRLRAQMRWFSMGAIVGGHQFVDDHLREYQTRTSKRYGMKVRLFSTHAGDNFDEMFSIRGGRDCSPTNP